MTLHWQVMFALGVGLLEWGLAIRRTIAIARSEAILACCIVFTENLLGLLVLSMFIKQDSWAIACSYSLGAALGTLVVILRSKMVEKENK